MTGTTPECNYTFNNKGYYHDNTKLGYLANAGWYFSSFICNSLCCLICMLITGIIISSSLELYTAANISFMIVTCICFLGALYNYYLYWKAKNNAENHVINIPQLPCTQHDGTISK